ncbi:hypothetical protein J3L11_09870 [Shewanella sp. 4t3-1-2LB]|uniref:hypothetical protein n=1 Tax=Shewanella sp. 4t3-1-2LB TaxID=2817682 RepID=UPI001A9973E4|nr:hypothetical protein [Shewanella sp. 4t3-1-2LB]MBO1271946.1 hypothetical protein [Shewanella sp. 4t3-1-2LB]
MTTDTPKSPPLDQSHSEETQKSFKWLIICLAIIAACLLALYFMNFHNGWGDKGDFGTFGDFFGGVLNPILGFATVGLLVWSLKAQREALAVSQRELATSNKQLAISNEELALTRNELKETKEEAKLSRQTMEKQVKHLRMETKLNEITRLLSDIRARIENKLSQKICSHIFVTENGQLLNFDDESKTFAYILGEQFRRDSYNIYWSVRQAQNGVQIGDEYIANPNSPDWLRLESLVICYSQLVRQYHRISRSSQFYEAYRLNNCSK